MLRQMADTIVHRGPDDFGFHEEGPVGFAFRRLSIVDLAGGHQPMSSEDGRASIVFNGEIYNHEALRVELSASGHHFRTTSDTEVLLHLYQSEGLVGFKRANGMFAIAIWDSRDRALHLVRDRLGVKPVYYAPTSKGLVFGSEIKALLASDLVAREINSRAVWDYLTFRYVPAPETIWNGVRKLPPAHVLTVTENNPTPRISRWWDMNMASPARGSEIPDAEYEEEFRALFEDAVNLRMRADVPVGITLSGGLDSSAVVSAARAASDKLMTFSVSFEQAPETDELPYARSVARAFGTDHHEVTIGARQFMDFLPDFVWLTDEPLADLASVPLFFVSRLAARHVKVVLSGEGSDEVFAGYNFETLARRWDSAVSVPKPGAGYLVALLSNLLPDLALTRGNRPHPGDQRTTPEPINMTNYWTSADKRALMRDARDWPDSHDKARTLLKNLGDQPPLNQALYLYCQDWLVEDLLMKADRMSMANSLELRTPFLDYRLVEWSARLPVRLKAGPSPEGTYRSKEILRRYAQSRIPAEIVNRPKQGFPVPVYGWLSTSLSGWAKEMLLSTDAEARDWFDSDMLQKIVAAGTCPDAQMIDRHRLWNSLILEQWMRRWLR